MTENSSETNPNICSVCKNVLTDATAHIECAQCNARLCENCAIHCIGCEEILCYDCLANCESCNSPVCDECSRRCDLCGKTFCEECADEKIAQCYECQENFCEDCGIIIEEGSIEDDKLGMESVCENCGGYRKKRHRRR
jgi:hypothetical protein